MATRMRAHDWASTPLGPLAAWPQSLRTAVDLLLDSGLPGLLAVGPSLLVLPNDAAGKPNALGRPLAEAWPELGDLAASVLTGAGSVRGETAWLSPLRDEGGAVVGVVVHLVDDARAFLAGFAVDEGFAICELVRDADGRAVDFRYLDVNQGFLRELGRRRDEVVGRLRSEVWPPEPEAFAACVRAVELGQPVRHELHAPTLDRWYDVGLFPRGGDRFAVLFDDISARKADETRLRESEARQAYLVRLADTLRPLGDPVQIQVEATRILGEQLGVDRAMYIEITDEGRRACIHRDHCAPGVFSVAGHYRIADFGRGVVESVLSGGAFVADDVDLLPLTHEERAAYAAVGVRALSIRTLVKDGEPVAMIAMHQLAPRRWTPAELELQRETAERTWDAVERAHAENALRESEALQAYLVRLGDRLRSLSDRRDIQREAARILGEQLAVARVTYRDLDDPEPVAWLAGGDEPETTSVTVVRSGQRVATMSLHAARAWTALDRAMLHETAERTWAASERAHHLAMLRTSEAQQAYLVRLADALRDLVDPLHIQAEAARVLGEHLGASRVHYGEMEPDGVHLRIRVDHCAPGQRSIVGNVPLAGFGLFVARTLDAGQILVRHDIGEETSLRDAERAAYADYQVVAFVAVPLVKAGRMAAVVAAHQDRPRRWTALEIACVRETAERTWAAIERARAEAAVAADLHDTGLLRELGERLIAESELDVLCQAIVAVALELTGAEGGSLQILDAGAVLRTFARQREWSAPFPQITPLLTLSGQPLGMITTHWRTPHRADERERRFLDLLARQAADLIENRRTNEALRDAVAAATAARREAEAANRAKDEFLTVLSHELRTPLAPIFLWGRMLQTEQVAPADRARAIDVIVESAKTQARLVEDLLDLSRIAAGRLSLVFRATEATGVARVALELIRPSAREKQIELVADLEDVGPVVLDPRRFQQILLNLLANAVKFTPPGGRVTLRLRRPRELVIQVIDNGEGMERAFVDHAFDRFRQAHMGFDRPHGGLGIGLALCRELVELHGGTIAADSEGPGHGACFTVRLPPSLSIDAAAEDGPADADADTDLRDVAVLLVEDEPRTRDAMRFVLERAGARVQAVGSAHQALQSLEQAYPDVLVCDLGLPGMDGYELIRRVGEVCARREVALLPACAVSAHVRDEDRKRAIEAGFDMHLSKPVGAQTLIEAVRDLVRVGEPASLAPREGPGNTARS